MPKLDINMANKKLFSGLIFTFLVPLLSGCITTTFYCAENTEDCESITVYDDRFLTIYLTISSLQSNGVQEYYNLKRKEGDIRVLEVLDTLNSVVQNSINLYNICNMKQYNYKGGVIPDSLNIFDNCDLIQLEVLFNEVENSRTLSRNSKIRIKVNNDTIVITNAHKIRQHKKRRISV